MIADTDPQTRDYGKKLGALLRGGECIELLGDVGAGKTTFAKGIGDGLLVDDDVQSPSFTLSREYACRDGLRMAHYDFYRLSDGGVLHYELAESLHDPCTITVVEWAETVGAVLPDKRIIVRFTSDPDSESRDIALSIPEDAVYLRGAI